MRRLITAADCSYPLYRARLWHATSSSRTDLLESAERALTFEEGIAEDRLSVEDPGLAEDSDVFGFDESPPFQPLGTTKARGEPLSRLLHHGW